MVAGSAAFLQPAVDPPCRGLLPHPRGADPDRGRSSQLSLASFDLFFPGRRRTSGRSATRTAIVFQASTLANLSGTQRGEDLSNLVRDLDATLHPDQEIADPPVGECCNGTRRGRHQAEFDWLRHDRRIECKSSQLQWDGKRWVLVFSAIKPSCHDELLLALYTPQDVYVYRHDSVFGRTSHGRSTASSGYRVKVAGPQHLDDWPTSLEAMLS